MQNRAIENQIRINEIARLIEELSTELTVRLNIEEDNQGVINTDIRREIILGDTVEITNNYRDQLGQQGVVVKITNKQVSIRLASTGRIIKKKKSKQIDDIKIMKVTSGM